MSIAIADNFKPTNPKPFNEYELYPNGDGTYRNWANSTEVLNFFASNNMSPNWANFKFFWIAGVYNFYTGNEFVPIGTPGNIKGLAFTDTVPQAGATILAQYIYFAGPGTYDNFPGADSNPIDLTENLNLISWDGTKASVQEVPVSVDLTGLATTDQLDQVKGGSDKSIKQIDDEQQVQSGKIDSIVDTTETISNVADSIPIGSADFRATTSTFSGWCSPIGTPNNFNALKFKLRARSVAITLIRIWILESSKSGAVLVTKDLIVNIAPGAAELIDVRFPLITNSEASQLVFGFVCNQFCDVFASALGSSQVYNSPIAAYATNGTMLTDPAAFHDATDVSGNTNIYVETYLTTPSYQSTEDFADSVINKSPAFAEINASQPGLLASKELTDKSIESVMLPDGEVYESIPNNGLDYRYTTSIFSGWCFPIGTPKNFDVLEFYIRPREIAISRIELFLNKNSKTGEVIASSIMNVNIPANTAQLIQWKLSELFANADNDNLVFGYDCDQLCDVYAIAPGSTLKYPSPKAAYATHGSSYPSLATFTDITAGNGINGYVRTYKAVYKTKPTTSFMEEIEAGLDTYPISVEDLMDVDIKLPSNIIAVSGVEINMYFKNFVRSYYPLDMYDINVDCAKGTQYQRMFRLKAEDVDAGSYSFTVAIYLAKKLIKTKTVTLHIAPSTKSGNINVIQVGDSLAAGHEILDTYNTSYGSDDLSVTFKGTQGSDPTKNEGYGGWTIDKFTTAGTTFYKFFVSGISTAPTVGSVYSDGTSTFSIVEINITAGSGYVNSTLASGPGTLASSGNLTKVSGTGDVAINYSETDLGSGNPFWNYSEGRLDFANYLSENSIALSSGDWVTIHLGINDIFSYKDDASALVRIDTMTIGLRALIDDMQSAVSGLKIGLCITTPPCANQDGFGANYGTGQTQRRYNQNLHLWQDRMIAEFDNNTEISANRFLIPYYLFLDTDYNMQTVTVPANSRTTATVTRYANGVHPYDTGYAQLADGMYAALKNY